MKQFKKVAVVYGGNSAERAVSLVSGQAVLEGLLRQNIPAIGIDAQSDLLERLKEGHFDHVFIVLHGRGGEDGTLQGALDYLGLSYTGSGVMGSAIAMDKYRSKLIWQGLGLPTADFVLLTTASDLNKAEQLGYPLMIKPANEGSSIGMSKVHNHTELAQAWHQAQQFDSVIIAEKWLQGKEFTVAILQDQALPAIRLETQNAFYDYAAKYESNDTQYHCPCGLSPVEEQQMQRIALQAFSALGATGWGRVDFIQNATGDFCLLEANTVPGMTSHSLVPMAAKASGIDFDALLLRILNG